MSTKMKKVNVWHDTPLRSAVVWLAFSVSAVGSAVYLLYLGVLVTAVIRDALGIARDTANAIGAVPSIVLVTLTLCGLTYFLGKRAFRRSPAGNA